jgi:hypothetical protein
MSGKQNTLKSKNIMDIKGIPMDSKKNGGALKCINNSK